MEPDGIIVAEMEKVPNVAPVYPPIVECDNERCWRGWLKYDLMLYPNYEVEELGEDYVVARRSDGVRFKVVSWLSTRILLELAKYPNGVDLFELLPVLLGWVATAVPEEFANPTDKLIAEYSESIVDLIGILYYELGLIEVVRVR